MSNKLNHCTPEEQGVTSQSILDFIEELETRKYDLHSFMFLRQGYVIAEGWWYPYGPDCKQYVYSLSDSVSSTAVGFAVSDILLTVEDKVISFFPDQLPE